MDIQVADTSFWGFVAHLTESESPEPADIPVTEAIALDVTEPLHSEIVNSKFSKLPLSSAEVPVESVPLPLFVVKTMHSFFISHVSDEGELRPTFLEEVAEKPANHAEVPVTAVSLAIDQITLSDNIPGVSEGVQVELACLENHSPACTESTIEPTRSVETMTNMDSLTNHNTCRSPEFEPPISPLLSTPKYQLISCSTDVVHTCELCGCTKASPNRRLSI